MIQHKMPYALARESGISSQVGIFTRGAKLWLEAKIHAGDKEIAVQQMKLSFQRKPFLVARISSSRGSCIPASTFPNTGGASFVAAPFRYLTMGAVRDNGQQNDNRDGARAGSVCAGRSPEVFCLPPLVGPCLPDRSTRLSIQAENLNQGP